MVGFLKGVVYCWGLLDSLIFEGSVEIIGRNMILIYDLFLLVVIDVVWKNFERGVVVVYDCVFFVFVFLSFIFNIDNGVSLFVFNGVEFIFLFIRVF